MVAATNLTNDIELMPRKNCAPAYRRDFLSEVGRERWDHEIRPLGLLHDEISLTRRQAAQNHLIAGVADQCTGMLAAHSLILRKG